MFELYRLCKESAFLVRQNIPSIIDKHTLSQDNVCLSQDNVCIVLGQCIHCPRSCEVFRLLQNWGEKWQLKITGDKKTLCWLQHSPEEEEVSSSQRPGFGMGGFVQASSGNPYSPPQQVPPRSLRLVTDPNDPLSSFIVVQLDWMPDEHPCNVLNRYCKYIMAKVLFISLLFYLTSEAGFSKINLELAANYFFSRLYSQQ